MEKKITKKEMFGMLLEMEEVKANEEMVAFINHEVELLNKKASSKKETATQKANEELKIVILDVLGTCEKGVTITELQGKNESLATLSNQKVSAIVRQMVESGLVKKVTEGKKSLFSLA